jgi:hypothetical protein
MIQRAFVVMNQRAFQPRQRVPTGTGAGPFRALPLEVISDEQGSIAIGWVGPGVLFSRSSGGISAEVGSTHAARIQSFADESPSVSFFIDASRVKGYDLLARSAFVRVLMANRRKFCDLVLLTFSASATPAEESMVRVVGEPFDLLRLPAMFDDRLLAVAPHARQLLERRSGSPARDRG